MFRRSSWRGAETHSQPKRRKRLRQLVLQQLESRNLLASVSAPPILQWFDSSYETIEERLPDVFEAGYGAIWLPPPGRADSGNQSVGYDVYNRFDLGSADHPTLYGTRTELAHLAGLFDRASTSLHIDTVLNHAGFSDQATDGFVASGGYPGLAITLDSAIDGDFHSSFASGDLESRLSGLVDIDHATNHVLVRHPVDINAEGNIPAGSETDPYGRLANVVDPSNAEFYPDRDGQVKYLFDPITNESDIPIYSFNTEDPMAGDAVGENALGYLMRYMQWMVEVIGVDGLRVDAAKHFDGFVMDYLDRAVYRSNPRLLLDGSTENVFSYSEVYDGDKEVLLSYVRKNIDPGDPGRIGGNRDVLDFSAFFAMRDNLSSPGTANAWFNVRDSLLDLHDDGLHNGSAGVLFVRSHDDLGPSGLGNVAHALTLMYPGNTVVYLNGKEFGAERDFPKPGRGDALGGVYGDTLKRLLSIRETHGRGDFYERWIDNEGLYIFERDRTAVVGLSNRGDGGFDERTVQVAFAPGTKLVELTGNAADQTIDPHGDIPEWVEVSESQTVTIRVPRNMNSDGQWHGSGFVIYGLATPVATTGIEFVGVESVLSGSTPVSNDYANGVTRLSDLNVVIGDQLTVSLNTEAVFLPGGTPVRDINADGDQAMLRVDGGIDLNGNGVVDQVTPGSVTYGFEYFQDVSSPLVGPDGVEGTRGSGEFRQTIDMSGLDEGMHFVEARAFRHRTDGGQPVYTEFRETIYLDRLPPDSAVLSFQPYTEGVNENRDLVIQSVDKTANNVHVFLDLPSGKTDSQILAMVNEVNQARKIDRDQFVYGFDNLTHGNHVATVVSYERTGNVNVQRFPGLFTSTIFGSGLGDLDFNGVIELADVELFETLVVNSGVDFNAAADFDGNGLINYADLQAYDVLLSEISADDSTRDELDRIRSLLFRANNDAHTLTEDQHLELASAGILINDLIPDAAEDFFLVTTGEVQTNLGAVALVSASGAWSYDARGRYDNLSATDSSVDYFDYTLDDGYGNESIGRVLLTITGVNDAPALSSRSTVEVDEDAFLERVNLGVFDPDHSVDSLAVSVSVDAEGLFEGDGPVVVLDQGNWWLDWGLKEDQFGQALVSLLVEDSGDDGVMGTDADNQKTGTSFQLIVNAVNDKPTVPQQANLSFDRGVETAAISISPISAGGSENQPLRIEVEVDNDELIEIPVSTALVNDGQFDLGLVFQEGVIGSATISVTVEDGGLDGNLTTDLDNETATMFFNLAVGISSYSDEGSRTAIRLRGDTLSPLLRRDGDRLIIEQDGGWFSEKSNGSFDNGSTLSVAVDEERQIQLNSAQLLKLQYASDNGWIMGQAVSVDEKFFRSLISSSVTPSVELLVDAAGPWQNLVVAADVDNSGNATAGDALRVINELRQRLYSDTTGDVFNPRDVAVWPGIYFDVNGDDRVTALDALMVINYLVRVSNSTGAEGEIPVLRREVAVLADRSEIRPDTDIYSEGELQRDLGARVLERPSVRTDWARVGIGLGLYNSEHESAWWGALNDSSESNFHVSLDEIFTDWSSSELSSWLTERTVSSGNILGGLVAE